MHCKICRINYPSKELRNLVSMRMYLQYQKHVSLRKELPSEMSSIHVVTNDQLSQSIRVCSYCYMLVISEFELISVEQKLASVLNIPLMDLNRSEDLNIQTQFLPKMLT